MRPNRRDRLRRRLAARRSPAAALILLCGLVATLPLAPAQQTAGEAELLAISSTLRLRVSRGRDLVLEVRAAVGEKPQEVARRVANDEESATAILAWNADADDGPDGEKWLRVPLLLLSDNLRRIALLNLFPDDRADGGGWVHVARSGKLPTYDEGLWQVATWFCRSGESFEQLMKANGLSSPELRRRQELRIPAGVLHPAFRGEERSPDGLLEFGTDGQGPYAGYTLKRGEALYSAVVVRFTGRTAAGDVGEVAEALRTRNGIRDLTDIPVGFRVKIPLDLLEADFLPLNHPRRLEAELQRQERARELEAQPVTETRDGLDGVFVVIDPGHGGKDLGTMNNGLWEHDYVYDVACRFKRLLERETRAKVALTLEDKKTGCLPSRTDKLDANLEGTILTEPPFLARKNGEAKIGVNLRWYLANSIYRRAVHEGTDPDRMLFISIHADSRHPSLRGVMVYVPGAGYRARNYGHSSGVYRRYAEVREKPQIRFSKKSRTRSEAVSRKYARKIVDAFTANSLPVQPYQPVRHRIIRGKARYVPAVLGGNAIPNKVLVELVNLSNPDDAALLGSKVERERLAAGLLDSLFLYFGEDPTRLAKSAPPR